MSIQSLIEEMKTATNKDIHEIRAKLTSEFRAATTSEQRGIVLALFTAYMDAIDRGLESHGADQKVLEDFRNARAYEYKSLVYQESMVGLDTPVVGADVSVDMLMAVTEREIAAGRMTEDHSARRIAVEQAAQPHLSHAELVEKHAKLKAAAASAEQSSASSTKVTPSSSPVAYAFGAAVGRKLKGLFRK